MTPATPPRAPTEPALSDMAALEGDSEVAGAVEDSSSVTDPEGSAVEDDSAPDSSAVLSCSSSVAPWVGEPVAGEVLSPASLAASESESEPAPVVWAGAVGVAVVGLVFLVVVSAGESVWGVSTTPPAPTAEQKV